MPLDFIEFAAFIICYLVPLAAIVSLVIFVIRKLNSIEKKVIELEKLLNEINNQKTQ